MRSRFVLFLSLLLCLALLAGCAQKPAEAPVNTVTETTPAQSAQETSAAEEPAAETAAPAETTEAAAPENTETDAPEEAAGEGSGTPGNDGAEAPEEEAEPAPEEDEPEEEEPGLGRLREVSEEGLEELSEELLWEYIGFYNCTYTRPEEIDWGVVLYNGGGLAVDATAELEARFAETRGYELYGNLIAIPEDSVPLYVKETTGTDYADAWQPLDWLRLEGEGLLCRDSIDFLFNGDYFTAGTYEDGVYRLEYPGINILGESCTMVLTVEDTGYGFHFLSNLPANADPSDPLYGPYGMVLRRYVSGLYWGIPDAEALESMGLSPLCAIYEDWPVEHSGDTLQYIGFLLQDLNGDGVDELLIGSPLEDFGSEYVFEVWTLKNERPIMILQSSNFSSTRLLEDGCIGVSSQENVFYAYKSIIALQADGSFFPVMVMEMEGDYGGATGCYAVSPDGERSEVSWDDFEGFDPHATAIIPDWTPLSALVGN